MLMSDVDLKSYTDTVYHNEELKSLTRYRFDKVRERAKLKQSVSRLVTILFPELEKLVTSLHLTSVYALLSEFPGAKQVAGAHLTHFLGHSLLSRFRMVCGNFILPEPASYVFFFALFNLRNLLYIIFCLGLVMDGLKPLISIHVPREGHDMSRSKDMLHRPRGA